MEQKLIINCATCDARTVAEETLQAYEKITVNCATLAVSPQSQLLLDRYHVAVNCANALRLDPQVVLKTINGSAVISPGPVPVSSLYLTVNGILTVEPGTQEVLSGYVGISVNGSLLAPKSLEASMPALILNGSAEYYPDEAVLLKRTAVVDHLFPLRTKADRLYWSAGRLLFLDSALDPRALAEKNVRFAAPKALIAQGLVEGIVPLLTDETDIEILPDGMRLIRDDLTLTPDTLRHYGSKLYILGDLRLPKESAAILPQVEQLMVKGDVFLPRSLAETFSQVPAEYHSLSFIRGQTLEDRAQVQLTRAMLEADPDGLTVRDCAVVRLDHDIPEQLILKKLILSDCAKVVCAPEQLGAVTLISEDVADIRTGDEAEQDEASSDGKSPAPQDPGLKVINASNYIL